MVVAVAAASLGTRAVGRRAAAMTRQGKLLMWQRHQHVTHHLQASVGDAAGCCSQGGGLGPAARGPSSQEPAGDDSAMVAAGC